MEHRIKLRFTFLPHLIMALSGELSAIHYDPDIHDYKSLRDQMYGSRAD